MSLRGITLKLKQGDRRLGDSLSGGIMLEGVIFYNVFKSPGWRVRSILLNIYSTGTGAGALFPHR